MDQISLIIKRPVLRGVLLCMFMALPGSVSADVATTTLKISICGNAIVDNNEVCDQPPNAGGYSTSTTDRTCEAACLDYGPYCGDGILQPLYGETCDDGNNIDGDLCDAICHQENPPGTGGTPPPPPPPPTSGGSGGQGGQFNGVVPFKADTRVVLEGKAYPLTDVNILKDGQIVGVARSESDASFRYETSSLTPGPATFGLWAKDNRGVKSITFSTTFQVIQNAVTTVSGVLLPPTIDAKEKKVKPGDPITFVGQTVPNANVGAYVDAGSDPSGTASTTDGSWSVSVDTTGMTSEAFHSAKALFTIPGTPIPQKSGYSSSLSFYVGNKDVGDIISADLNHDGKVNLVDFSILLFHWGTDDIIADLNQDGKVDLVDFSILLFNWTG